MKNGKFETQREIYQALLDKKVLRYRSCEAYLQEDGKINKAWNFIAPSDWSIQEPKRETIELFETYNSHGIKCICDKEGRYPDFRMDAMANDDFNQIRKQNIINPDKPTMVIYADTFLRVEE